MKIQKADLSCHFDAIKEIFFLCSSRKKFESNFEKEVFFNRWTTYYVEFCPDEILVAVDEKGIVAGYLMGCSDSLKAEKKISEQLPAYSVFSDLFEEYPSHFHINCHPNFQGQGIGTKLLQHYCLAQNKGVHLVTSTDAKNIEFYRRNGFTYSSTRKWKGINLLFLGRAKLNPQIK